VDAPDVVRDRAETLMLAADRSRRRHPPTAKRVWGSNSIAGSNPALSVSRPAPASAGRARSGSRSRRAIMC
jgi:hypothetical protein